MIECIVTLDIFIKFSFFVWFSLVFFLYSQRGRRRKVIYFVLLFSSFLYYFPFAIPAVHLFFRLNNSNSNNRKADGPLGLFVDNNKSCFPSRRWRKVGASLSCGYWSSTTRWPKMFKKVNLSKTHRLDPSSPPPLWMQLTSFGCVFRVISWFATPDR